MEPIIAPKGLDGVIVDKSSIATTDNEGNLVYRGYQAAELAEKASFEQTAYLVVYGRMPNKEELKEFSEFLYTHSSLNDNIKKIIALNPEDTEMMDLIRSIVSLTPLIEKKPDKMLLELSAKVPRVISDGHRILKNLPVFNDFKGSYAERFYYLLTGKEDKASARYFEKLLILYMEHEFNASTFALRVTASTLADPKAALTTALATLKGPLHGGANEEILDYILSMKTTDDAIKFVDAKLSKKEKIMGFGHRIYKKIDPRAQLVKKELKELSKSKNSNIYDIAVAIEETVWERKKLPANLDFYAALYMHLLGIEQVFYTPIFAAARSFGWSAHYLEQVSDNKLIRPQSQYTGPVGLKLR